MGDAAYRATGTAGAIRGNPFNFGSRTAIGEERFKVVLVATDRAPRGRHTGVPWPKGPNNLSSPDLSGPVGFG